MDPGVCATGAEHRPVVLLTCTVEHHLLSWDSTGAWDQSRRSSVCTSTYTPACSLTLAEQDLLCTLISTCAACIAPFWLSLARRSPGYGVQEELHQAQRGGTSACERMSGVSAEMGYRLHGLSVQCPSYIDCSSFHRLPCTGVLSKQIKGKASTEHCAERRYGLSLQEMAELLSTCAITGD